MKIERFLEQLMVPIFLQRFRLNSEASNSTLNGPFMGKTFTSIKTYYVKFTKHNMKFSRRPHIHKAIHGEFLCTFNLHTKVHTSSLIRLLVIVINRNAQYTFFPVLAFFYTLQKNHMRS
jgi:hypothetical protein